MHPCQHATRGCLGVRVLSSPVAIPQFACCAEQISRSKAVVDEIVQFALDAGGTCTGEHGLGHGKLHSALQEHGPVVIDCMHAIKTALDPNHILNPGKVGSPLEVFSQPRRR